MMGAYQVEIESHEDANRHGKEKLILYAVKKFFGGLHTLS
jgi:hypothetical protein